ncbi:disulfide oxidoreductase [Pontibacillus salipaludis]|uniref:disulfide oxidoreductase n=1 Tax=Pontibacillus salipaludis TaxID=1697394 RepID=UPI0031EF3D94
MMSERVQKVLFFTWLTSVLATFGSLFFSEVMDFIPCEKCWYQRILMYPLVLLYGIALARKDLRYGAAGLFMSGLGVLVAAYHYGMQKLPFLKEAGDGCSVVSCGSTYINWGGFITIPLLSFTAFTIIFVCHLWMVRNNK